MDPTTGRPDANLTRTLKRMLFCSLAIIGMPLALLFFVKRSVFENSPNGQADDERIHSKFSGSTSVQRHKEIGDLQPIDHWTSTIVYVLFKTISIRRLFRLFRPRQHNIRRHHRSNSRSHRSGSFRLYSLE